MPDPRPREREIVLLDLLDRALDKGIVLSGELVISVADVDLVYVGLNVLLSSVDRVDYLRSGTLLHAPAPPPDPDAP